MLLQNIGGSVYNFHKAGLMYGLTRPDMAKMKTLVGRAAEPQEIVDLILFIASEKGQFINGENIMIDGGRNAMNRG